MRRKDDVDDVEKDDVHRHEDEMIKPFQKNEERIPISEEENDYAFEQEFCKDYRSEGYRWVCL